MNGKFLGKIIGVQFGLHTYKFGLSVDLKFEGGNVTAFEGCHAEYPKHAQFPREQWEACRQRVWDEFVELLRKAKVNDVAKLFGKPVEVEIEHNAIKSWRILEEVL